MDEHDLITLRDEPLDPAGAPRPVDDVFARGRRVRRRATLARVAPVVVALALLGGVGAVALRGDRQGEVAVTTNPGDDLLPMRPEFCEAPDPEPVPAGELDGLRLVPTTLPGGVEVSAAQAARQSGGTCVQADPALVLRAVGGGGTVDAEITLDGPFDDPYPGADDVVTEPTRLRGRPASRISDHTAEDSYVGFTWTEPDGASWILKGVGLEEASLRQVAEALVLRRSPAEGEPAASLPDDAVPAGFDVAWQAQGVPMAEGPTWLEWVVTTNPPWPAGCDIAIRTTAREAAPGRLYTSSADSRTSLVDVRGGEGLAIEEHGGVSLAWQEAPGVVGSLFCGGDLDTALRVADSLVEVAADDPRITTDAVTVAPGG
jgi:hypothetical protein